MAEGHISPNPFGVGGSFRQDSDSAVTHFGAPAESSLRCDPFVGDPEPLTSFGFRACATRGQNSIGRDRWLAMHPSAASGTWWAARDSNPRRPGWGSARLGEVYTDPEVWCPAAREVNIAYLARNSGRKLDLHAQVND